MKKELMNLFMFLAICFATYIIFRGLNFNLINKEGMTNSTPDISSSSNGIAGNAAGYGATIKAETVKMQDEFLISKYRKDYENIILNLDDYINFLMLKTSLSIDKSNPEKSFSKLSEMNEVKLALNNVMKFVDASA
jgi:hypothetical protein